MMAMMRFVVLCLAAYCCLDAVCCQTITEKEIAAADSSSASCSVCRLEPDSGPCEGEETRWYFDIDTGFCQQFIYGGCQGNANNFETKEACLDNTKICLDECERCTICQLPSDVGFCDAVVPRYYFNADTGMCEFFTYGGCGGNVNNFETLVACQEFVQLSRCLDEDCLACTVCALPPHPGDDCDAVVDPAVVERWYYNSESQSCETFSYSVDCGGGNANNFETLELCQAFPCQNCPCSDGNRICNLPKRTGPCEAYIERWYYNNGSSSSCEKFIYGGCQGNDNNFPSQQDCESVCPYKEGCPCAICRLPMVIGPCGGAFPRWYFDAETGVCTSFSYGGCGGNANNFADLEECEEQGCLQQCVNPCSICALPADPGPCLGGPGPSIPRWYFNAKTGACEMFGYVCLGNANNFETKEECEAFPCEDCKCTYCSLPPDSGPCEALIERWYFDKATCSCKTFTYGGCEGNLNNFETQDECEAFGCKKNECSEACFDTCSICRLPKDIGPCDGAFERWYFNSETGVCELFFYGGCGGNINNFESLDECEKQNCGDCLDTCEVCGLPAVQGPCEAIFPRWYFDQSTCSCESFIYGGCFGNNNNFVSFNDCEAFGCYDKCNDICSVDKCSICALPADPGPCDGPEILRWYFNAKMGVCETFGYGGCGGNANNYETKEECEAFECEGCKCTFCTLPPDSGPCEAAIEHWYFDKATCSCKTFTYGGCLGNVNNFETQDKCEAFGCVKNECSDTCGDKKCSICRLPAAPGPCLGAFTRYFFNIESGLCERFIYGGCGGNDNNFASLEDCQKLDCRDDCLDKCDICSFPPEAGDCEAAFERWYFNIDSCTCETFTYGGCGGNANNFGSLSDCQALDCDDGCGDCRASFWESLPVIGPLITFFIEVLLRLRDFFPF